MVIDPRGRLTVTAGTDILHVRPRTSPLFKTKKKIQAKTMFATGEIVGLAEWIIDDICLVSYCNCFN